MLLKKVCFGTTKIQSLRRIALDQNILTTLGLRVGDTVSVDLDTESGTVLITRAKEEMTNKENKSKSKARPARVKGK